MTSALVALFVALLVRQKQGFVTRVCRWHVCKLMDRYIISIYVITMTIENGRARTLAHVPRSFHVFIISIFVRSLRLYALLANIYGNVCVSSMHTPFDSH